MEHDEQEEDEKLVQIVEFGWKLLLWRMQDSRMTHDQMKRVCAAAEAEIGRIENEPDRPLSPVRDRDRKLAR